MSKQKFPCKHHPEALSSRRCFQCKKYICSDCQKRHLHHLFCSYLCLAKYVLFEKLLSKQRYREYAVIILIMTFIQLVLFWVLGPVKEDTGSTAPDVAPVDSTMIQARELQYSADTLFSNTRQAIKIYGTAPANTLVGLWNNGRYQSAAVSGLKGYEFRPQALSIGTNSFIVWGLNENGKTTLIDSITIKYASARISALSVPLNRSYTEQKLLSLTFDGGSMANGADSIISILEKKNIKTTFFLTGQFITKYSNIVKSMLEHNHELANHTYSHPHLTSFVENNQHQTLEDVDREFIKRQLLKSDSLLSAGFMHHFKPYWRAPFGEYNQEILLWAAEAGYKHVGWSRRGDTRDWISDKESPLYRSAEDIYNYLVDMESRDQLKGAILLMHLHSDRYDDLPYKILPRLIDFFQSKGYRFVTISQLINLTSPL